MCYVNYFSHTGKFEIIVIFYIVHPDGLQMDNHHYDIPIHMILYDLDKFPLTIHSWTTNHN